MPKTPSSSPVNQTAIGNDNIQVVGSHNVITRITNLFAGGTEQERAYRDRRRMLELVKNTWIKGVLEKSLYNEILIDLAMDTLPGKVDHPWDIQIEMSDQVSRTFPSGTSMIDVFDEMNCAMLILGEPGSGKTTMLLELARDCIDRAMQDHTQPIPVLFNLSSWDAKQTLEDWLIKELRTKYTVPLKTAQLWMMNDNLQLLLDGLDEVKLENREKCVEAIDKFRQKHGLTTPIAVCSRTTEYEALTGRLDLQGAVSLQPLTAEQINNYFEQVGPKLAGLNQMLKKDEVLQELARQPLMLSIMTLAYQDKPTYEVASNISETIETRRNRLFDAYIEKMFGRVARTKNQLYAPEQIKAWLTWLARKMMEYNQVPFLVEEMQPKWLDQSRKRIFSGLFGLISYLLMGLIFAFTYHLPLSVVRNFSSSSAPIMGIIISLLLWLNDGTPAPVIRNWISRLLLGLVSGSVVDLLPGLSGAAIYGVLISLSFGWLGSLSEIRTAARVTWNWRNALVGVLFAVVIGLIIGFIEGFFAWATVAFFYYFPESVHWTYSENIVWLDALYNFLTTDLKPGSVLQIGLWVWISQAIINAILVSPFMVFLLAVRYQQLSKTTYPGQRLVHWFRNSSLILLSTALLSEVIALINDYAGFWLVTLTDVQLGVGILLLTLALNVMLILAIPCGLISGLRFGATALLQHYALRFIIARNNQLPWRVIPFLDYCVDRIFLRRAGGGYIFAHRLLMEHFAAMPSDGETAKKPPGMAAPST